MTDTDTLPLVTETTAIPPIATIRLTEIPLPPPDKPKRTPKMRKDEYVVLYTQAKMELHEKDIKIASLNAQLASLANTRDYPNVLHFVALFVGIVCGVLITLLAR